MTSVSRGLPTSLLQIDEYRCEVFGRTRKEEKKGLTSQLEPPRNQQVLLEGFHLLQVAIEVADLAQLYSNLRR
jgi:hypothetical protein